MGWLIGILLKPVAAILLLPLPYALAFWIWRIIPDGKVKRALFRSYGEDRGPWMFVEWQRKKHRAFFIDRCEKPPPD